MARKKLSEYFAKKMLLDKFGLSFNAIEINDYTDLDLLSQNLKKDSYVLKVDQGVKGRMKKGLIILNSNSHTIVSDIESLRSKGYNNFILEEILIHETIDEKFISIEREREGLVIYYSNKGGINIEDNKDSIEKTLLDKNSISTISQYLSIPVDFFEKLYDLIQDNYISFLEINPLVIKGNQIFVLDLAIEVDDTAEYFVNGSWDQNYFVKSNTKTEEEKNVELLAEKSTAALKLDVLNPDGSIFVLLSGGGASIVLADEIYNLGFGKELANYGEYSGSPTTEETYLYTKNLLSLLSKSKATKKVLIIGGGVANFTDIRSTFTGVIKALDEVKDHLKATGLKVFVRRGGPHEKEGLLLMKEFLENAGIYGYVTGPEMILTDIITLAIKALD
jgi:ATP-citrate lyase beta-subunit